MSDRQNDGDNGSRCVCCGTRIPVCDPRVPNKVAERIKDIIKTGYTITAIKELRAATGLGLRDAKYWIDHCGISPGRAVITGPCPYCGEQLRTNKAKQCRHCKRDWHDPDSIQFMAGS